MRTTLNIDPDLLREAAKAAGIQEKTRLIHLGLDALIRAAAERRLSRLYGMVRRARTVPRRRVA